jgi:hypothetical protein
VNRHSPKTTVNPVHEFEVELDSSNIVTLSPLLIDMPHVPIYAHTSAISE